MEFFSHSQNKELFEGEEFVDITDGDKKVVEKIKTAIGIQNPFGLAYAHDIVALVDLIVSDFYTKNNRMPSGKEFSDALIQLKEYKGAVGDVAIDESGVMNPQAVIKVMKDGNALIVEE